MKKRKKCRKYKKICYPTREDALISINAQKLLGVWTARSGQSARVYKCPSCGEYHITSMSHSQQRRALEHEVKQKWGIDGLV
jgi:hypothetical protein